MVVPIKPIVSCCYQTYQTMADVSRANSKLAAKDKLKKNEDERPPGKKPVNGLNAEKKPAIGLNAEKKSATAPAVAKQGKKAEEKFVPPKQTLQAAGKGKAFKIIYEVRIALYRPPPPAQSSWLGCGSPGQPVAPAPPPVQSPSNPVGENTCCSRASSSVSVLSCS
ncbi:unnamed protein product [Cyprideis torosa]|uniref:Uncharacterized protein n=1 Tax=Cyprideis torosa TaxID=163714 RepID=A0A7R8W873_9CRUS|nr:unnamed protein product [Cyprideis torosa]CAG0888313.1 unnamed protein product [Cyprideis torosa]